MTQDSTFITVAARCARVVRWQVLVGALVLVGVAAVHVASAGALLPDGRVYEMVSPVEKGSRVVNPGLAIADAAGEHVIVDGGAANSQLASGTSWELETRTPSGWTGTPIGPPSAVGSNFVEQDETALVGVSEDVSKAAFLTQLSLDPRDEGSDLDIYLREGAGGPLTWISGPPAPLVKLPGTPLENYAAPGECANIISCFGNNAIFAGASSDMSDIVWSQRTPLVAPPAALAGSPPDTHTYGYEVYESVAGADQLVGVVPASGTECGSSHSSCVVPPCGAAMGNSKYEENEEGEGGYETFAPVRGSVSKEGSQVIFTSPDPGTAPVGCPPAELYLRQGGSETVEVSASQKTNGSGAGGSDLSGPQPKLYVGSAEEGNQITEVLFTSKEELTNAANTGSADQGNDLYSYNLLTGQLSDLTADHNGADANGASVSSFIGASTNGSRVYFTAGGVLAPGATAGSSNLYVFDATTGQTTFIAPGAALGANTEVTPSGEYFVFLDSESLSGYQQEGKAEVYRYDAATNDLVCVSCDPDGVPPIGAARLPGPNPGGVLGAIRGQQTLPSPLVMSDDGARVFFDSPDQLTVDAPSPTEQPESYSHEYESNVYEYEEGQIHLIAPATPSSFGLETHLLGTTPSGNDVFFSSLDKLVPQDTDGTADVYDARVDGGFPALTPPACSGTSCQGVPAAAPIFATPASVTFEGIGNFAPPAPTKASALPKKKTKKAKKKTKKQARRKDRRKKTKPAKKASARSKRRSK